eukprot:911287-Amphidinium_carterae.1
MSNILYLAAFGNKALISTHQLLLQQHQGCSRDHLRCPKHTAARRHTPSLNIDLFTSQEIGEYIPKTNSQQFAPSAASAGLRNPAPEEAQRFAGPQSPFGFTLHFVDKGVKHKRHSFKRNV